MNQQNSYSIDVEVTHLTPEQRYKVKAEYMARKGFINFSVGWENQHKTTEKMVYTFWYANGNQEGHMNHRVSDDQTLEVLSELYETEYDELVKVKRFDIQGSGLNGKIFKKE